MTKTTKNWLIAAAALIFAGALLFVTALALGGWNIDKLGTVEYVETTLEPSGDFENIAIKVYTTDIKFLPAEDGKCRIVCCEDEKVKHTAEVRDGALVVDTDDSRIWLNFISFSFKNPTMTVYLPKSEYSLLGIETDTGAVDIPKDFAFESIDIQGHTGAVKCSASAERTVEIELDTGAIALNGVSAGNMKLKTDTGSIKLDGGKTDGSIVAETGTGHIGIENIECGEIRADVDTGRVDLKNVGCGGLYAETDTGDIELENVLGSGKFELISDTGDIGLNGCDAAELYIETDTGSISGKLLSDKIYFAESDAGRVSVPKTSTGGRCEIKTDTGSIDFE